MEDGDHKVIIFSEWERMLELVRELATRMEVGFAWHTGSVPQIRRRTEIKRFKQDPACRLFLSTDSGSVGLNLQAANVVINLDQPWNPAKLEQRIARAWRKHQTRNVQVINLVTEHSIEHRIVHLLEQKRALAAGVVDGAPETTSMKLPSGRAAFLERVQSLVGEAPPPRPARRAPQETLREDVLSRWSSRLDLLAVQPSGDGHGPTVLAVADRIDEDLRASLAGEVSRSYPDPALRLELLDRQTYETILRLAEAGVIRINEAERAVLHESPTLTRHSAGERERRLSRARKAFEDAQRKQRMATVLAEGGFAVEASIPLREAVEAAVGAAAGLLADSPSPGLPAAPMIARLAEQDHIPANTPAVVERLKQATGTATDQITELLATGHGIVDHVARSLGMGG